LSTDNGPNDRGADATSGIGRREVLLTVGGVAATVGAGAAIWGGLEFFVSRQHTVGSRLMVLGTLACVLGVSLSIRTARTRFDDVGAARKDVNIGVARVPALVFARLVAVMALIVLPAGAVFLANYHTFAPRSPHTAIGFPRRAWGQQCPRHWQALLVHRPSYAPHVPRILSDTTTATAQARVGLERPGVLFDPSGVATVPPSSRSNSGISPGFT
jgi:hypothetical protein